jgi:hypothetical protein
MFRVPCDRMTSPSLDQPGLRACRSIQSAYHNGVARDRVHALGASLALTNPRFGVEGHCCPI